MLSKIPLAQYFKFQSDSINTEVRLDRRNEDEHFKFQSDSINTQSDSSSYGAYNPLNSNLILLIPDAPVFQGSNIMTLNSNLILLIRSTSRKPRLINPL